jgi:hypothetical protein
MHFYNAKMDASQLPSNVLACDALNPRNHTWLNKTHSLNLICCPFCSNALPRFCNPGFTSTRSNLAHLSGVLHSFGSG